MQFAKVNTIFTNNDWNVDNGRLQNITSTQVSTGTQLQNSTYNYDSVGNILTITDSLLGPQTQSFAYDALDRLTNSSVTGGSNGLYTEGYSYDDTTGNLASKNSAAYTYSASHKHAVTSLSNGNTYGYDQNGNMTSRHIRDGETFKDYTLNYDAENRLVSVTGAATASFVYDGDSKQIKATVNGITAVYVGNHYEVKNSIVTKYYFAGATRLAVRTGTTLSYLLSDHLGSSSVTTNANGAKTATALYKAFGETRYTLGNLGTDYQFTGQRLQAELGIYWFQSRWMDPSLGRFTSPDTIVPTSTQGTQAWDRYGFVNNNPVRYNDPTGHQGCSPDERDEGSCEENEQPYCPDGSPTGPCFPPGVGIYSTSFQMFPATDPYYYGQSGEESYTGFSGSGDNGSGASAAAGVPGLINDFLLGIRPTILRKTTPYDQEVSVGYGETYQGIPRIDAQRTVTATSLTIQNNSNIDSAINYSIIVSGGGQAYRTSTSNAPGGTTTINLPSIRIPSGGLNVAIRAFTGCTGPCIRTENPSVFQGFISFLLNP